MKNSSNELLQEVKAHFGGGSGGIGAGNVAVANVANAMGIDSGANGYVVTNGGTVSSGSVGRPTGSGTCTGGPVGGA